MHSRDAARLAQNVAVLDLLDTEREGRLDAAGFRDTLRRALSAFEASSASDAEPADPEADARESRVLRTNVAWAMTRCGDDAGAVFVSDAVAPPSRRGRCLRRDGRARTTGAVRPTRFTRRSTSRRCSRARSRFRGRAKTPRRLCESWSVAEAMATPFGDADDAERGCARTRALRWRSGTWRPPRKPS